MQQDPLRRSDNPLLCFEGLPRFDEIRPEHVEPAVDALLAACRAERTRLLARPGPYRWDNLVQPMEDVHERLDRAWAPVAHLHAVMDSEALRAAYNACIAKLSAYGTELHQDARLYRAYLAVRGSAEFERLDRAQRKIIDNTLRDCRLSGAELGPAQKRRFKKIQLALAELGSRFEQNLLDATDAWELWVTDSADLGGLPPASVEAARERARRSGRAGWVFTLHAPSYTAFMRHADNRALRRRMYEAYVCRASDQGPHAGRWDNGPIIERIVRLRREAARLLGYANYAEYSLVTKMAGGVEEVIDFLSELAARARPAAERELEQLRRFARASCGIDQLEAWDIPYCSEKLRRALFDFSQEDLRPYFPEARVLAGMFEIVRRLFGVEVRETDPPQTWHRDVRFFEIRDADGRLRARFYADLYARRRKRAGAWMDECVSRKRTERGVQIPVAFLTCNFSPPLGAKPALLTHEEVLTLFHEFGHGLHHMLTRVDYVSVAGINGVAWDAVELPSQLMENWCWEHEALALISGHYRTQRPLPASLIDKMRTARNFQAGMEFLRQIEYALFDMRLHGDFDPRGEKSIQNLLDDVRREVAVVVPPPFNRFQNGFAHIFGGGYAAGYYSYKWAEVLSADAFAAFEENGVFDRATGEAFLRHVLEQGGTRDPMELFIAFRGREPRLDALLRRAGLVTG